MSRRPLITAAASALAVLVSTVGLTAANAAEPDPTTPYQYSAVAGGSFVQAVGTTAQSDYTAQSKIAGAVYPASASNTTAAANVGTLIQAGAVSTSTNATKVDNTVTSTAKAQTAGISLLGGKIKLSGLTTVTEAKRDGVVLSGDSDSELLGLVINGTKYASNVNNNFGVNISGIATVLLNEKNVTIDGPNVTVTGSALKVTLLKAYEGSPIGTTIIVNPTQAILTPKGPQTGNLGLGGYARGTYATINSGDSVVAVSGPTAYVSIPPGGTYGYDITNSTAKLNVPFILTTGVIQSTANGVTSPTVADVTHTNSVANINALNGLVKASALKVVSRSQRLADGSRIQSPSAQILGLVINGKSIATASAAPNTTITVPGVVKVVLNEQAFDPRANTVVGIHITLLQPRSGLKTGAEIYIGIAGSIVF